ncbi:hypothetical protein D6D21_10701 [Aureobasidium pullulans]|uniref:Uncharacterized protein n=1 Tax=Aureobasidium pullulans TaxID=5580 RepID=A0AB74IH62_AURPU|nr:hypothetical protein D6D21_10701 [Aureobasidium pullulans]
MCFGEQTEIECDICDSITVQEIIWLGCHAQDLDDDSYTCCPKPLICTKYLTKPCLTCVFETVEDIDTDDEHVDYPDHPGFPTEGLKHVIQVPVGPVDLPAPTDFKTIEALENLAGPTDELPRYEDIPHDVPPPSWELSEIREDGRHSEVIDKAIELWQSYITMVRVHMARLEKLYWRITVAGSLAYIKVDFAEELIKSCMLDAEDSITRIKFLDETLSDLKRQSEEEWFMQSPTERDCLQQKIDAIVRELQDYLEQFDLFFFVDYDLDWDRRLECLEQDIADHIDVENSEKFLNESRNWRSCSPLDTDTEIVERFLNESRSLRSCILPNADVEISERFLDQSRDLRSCWCT